MAAMTAVARAPFVAQRIAALPMYDPPALQPANDALWRALSLRLIEAGIAGVPERLTRGVPPAMLWREPRLMLAQCCGYPLATALRGLVKLVATPRYRAPGCHGVFARSAIIVRRDHPAEALAELRGRRCVINEDDSNTGMNLLRAAVARVADRRPFFRAVLVSGSHRESLGMIAAGEADVAAIDPVTLAHLQLLEPRLAAAVRVLDWTLPSLSLPLVTSRDTDAATIAALRAALADIAVDPGLAAMRETLFLAGFDALDEIAYDSVLEIERSAVRRGYPHLC